MRTTRDRTPLQRYIHLGRQWQVQEPIERWEADGETYIDGIGTQMHISCYEDANLQMDAENHIVKMLQLMANNGKLCRVSELARVTSAAPTSGRAAFKTADATPAEHKMMVNFYKFVITKYFEWRSSTAFASGA